MPLFDEILKARGLDGENRESFLLPDYEAGHDPFLLPDMMQAVERLVRAQHNNEHVTIYGDYDIDGLTATSVLLDAFSSFGFTHVKAFIPNRFVEGYGLTCDAIDKIAKTGAALIVTVDCGSLSEKEIRHAGTLGIDVIVTDHHNVAPVQPPAVAVINPKRLLQDYPERYEAYRLKAGERVDVYPFLDLPGVGVAFKLVQAMQTRLKGLEKGQEKWLLDLVALGTVCDVVTLVDENRTHVYWGLKVLAQTRRPGLRALMAVAGIEPSEVNARHLGFGLGPRMNAAGRLETAQFSLDMLTASDKVTALEAAAKLDDMNVARRAEQDGILAEALQIAERYTGDAVLVVSGKGWNHGIIGIVAAKLLEKFQKPTYVLEEMEDGEAKGSARSYGEFSVADAIRASDDIITKGGGHRLAAGVTLPVANIGAFRARVNEYYHAQKYIPSEQRALLLPKADVEVVDFTEVDEVLLERILSLEPFGNGNPEPILATSAVEVVSKREMGDKGQHVKLELEDTTGRRMAMVAFNALPHLYAEAGSRVRVWFSPIKNEWRGRVSVEGRLLHLELAES